VKKPLIIAAGSILLLAGIGAAVFLRPPTLQSSARRDWKQKSITEIGARVADPMWPTNELTRLQTRSTSDSGVYESWLSDRMIVARNGEWLAYANICRKEDRRIHDLFLARGSDGRWYYSTYHFCIGVVALRMEEQPEDLTGFTKAYFLRTFDGKSDDCLQKTWPPDSR
jgi:hypothetical protein